MVSYKARNISMNWSSCLVLLMTSLLQLSLWKKGFSLPRKVVCDEGTKEAQELCRSGVSGNVGCWREHKTRISAQLLMFHYSQKLPRPIIFQYNSMLQQIFFNTGLNFMWLHTTLKLMCTTCNLFKILCKDGLMMVWWPKRSANKLNNKAALCLTENKYTLHIYIYIYIYTGVSRL